MYENQHWKILIVELENKKINALINLLEDEDCHVAAEAMQQLLSVDTDVDALVAEFQESKSPVLRNRIHQMGNVLKLRRNRKTFIENAVNLSIGLWYGVLEINHQYNPSMSIEFSNNVLSEIAGKLADNITLIDLAEFMRDEEFIYASEDMLGVDLYLIEDVLIQRIGAPVMLTIIAYELAQRKKINAHIVIFNGKHCLLDADNNLIEPAENWNVTRLTSDKKVHFCGKKDLWLTVLSQLFLASLLEGRLLTIYRSGFLLSKLCGGELSQLNHPLGSKTMPKLV